MAIAINRTKIIGFNNSGETKLTIQAPSREPMKINGKSFETSLKSTLPERMKAMVLVKDPMELANLFVAIAADGESPENNKAGIEIRPPPPTTESMNAAKNPKNISSKSVEICISSIQEASVSMALWLKCLFC
jgi:hypothetical protein